MGQEGNLIDDLFGLGIGYELFSLASHRVPPITVLCDEYPWLMPVVLLVVGAHLVSHHLRGMRNRTIVVLSAG